MQYACCPNWPESIEAYLFQIWHSPDWSTRFRPTHEHMVVATSILEVIHMNRGLERVVHYHAVHYICACRMDITALPRSQPKTLHTQDESFRPHCSSPRS